MWVRSWLISMIIFARILDLTKDRGWRWSLNSVNLLPSMLVHFWIGKIIFRKFSQISIQIDENAFKKLSSLVYRTQRVKTLRGTLCDLQHD